MSTLPSNCDAAGHLNEFGSWECHEFEAPPRFFKGSSKMYPNEDRVADMPVHFGVCCLICSGCALLQAAIASIKRAFVDCLVVGHGSAKTKIMPLVQHSKQAYFPGSSQFNAGDGISRNSYVHMYASMPG